MSEAGALLALAASLAAAVARPRWAPDWAVAALAALVLLACGVLSGHQADSALSKLGPTVGFLAALLVFAYACGEAGLFEALGATMASGARGRPRRLLAMVFLAAAGTTAVLGLDATVLLLTPVVFATAARLRTSSRPHVYACTHLANSASLLLPISNLTNLLAFQSAGMSFARFAALMVLPWLVVIAIEWLALSGVFRGQLRRYGREQTVTPRPADAPPIPIFPLLVLGATLVGFGVSSLIGIAPVWFAAAGALVLASRQRVSLPALARSAEPGFLLFVLALGVVVHAAGEHGLSSFVRSLLPHGTGLPQLLAIAGVSAVAANLLNNLPATLIILPVAAASGPGALLAMLIGVGVGPNMTYTGSLATLLWRRVVHAHSQSTDLLEFTRLGLLTVPAALAAGTACLWVALKIVG